MEWCTIESDPGVFTELIENIGVKGVSVEEIYDLDVESLQHISPIYGFIFLFKYGKQEPRLTLEYYDQELFFANQVIQNACATQAILSVLLNVPELELGQELTQFKEMTQGMDSYSKGESLAYLENVRKVHNSFQRPEPFVYEQSRKAAKDGDDVFHFISYIPFKGKVYELDGLKKGPIVVAEYQSDQWEKLAIEEIQKRIQTFQSHEVKFNLMAIIKDQKSKIQNEIQKEKQIIYNLYEKSRLEKIKLESKLEKICQEIVMQLIRKWKQ